MLPVISFLLLLQAPAGWDAQLSLPQESALTTISADRMRKDLTYLASDELEGRGTPSKGLDLAAKHIAEQFRAAGLDGFGDKNYFQKTTFVGRGETVGVEVSNVVGFIKGSDPALQKSYIIVSAHYDHLGKRDSLEGDKIFNGANDDASGTTAVVEIARAIGALKQKPKRSILFITFYGEERGLVGSRFYASAPLVPLKDTIANVNIEQIGRTDDVEGPRVSAANLTGYDFSNLGKIFAAAGEKSGVPVVKHERFSDPYFNASDNAALASKGVVAHTVSTSYEFPDYHKVGDETSKIDFANLEKVTRMIARGILMLANSEKVPAWDETNPKTARYVTAFKALQTPPPNPK